MNRQELINLRRSSMLAIKSLYVAVIEGVYDNTHTRGRLAVAEGMHAACCRELQGLQPGELPAYFKITVNAVLVELEKATEGGSTVKDRIQNARLLLEGMMRIADEAQALAVERGEGGQTP